MTQRLRSEIDFDRYLKITIDELTDELGGTHAEEDIVQEAWRAMRDLRGSISAEALPEMVGRLVHVRLDSPSENEPGHS